MTEHEADLASHPGIEGDPRVDAARPEGSVRDPESLAAALGAWLGSVLPASASPRVVEASLPSGNGMSSDTVLFRATWADDGDEVEVDLVARVAPAADAVPVFPTYDIAGQFATIAGVAAHSDVPVPPQRWLETDEAALGAPFFVMERVEGRVPPDVLPYNFGSWLSEADVADQQRLQDGIVSVLARLAAIEDAPARFAHLPGAAEAAAGGSALRAHVERERRFYDWVAGDGPRSTLIDAAFDWLDAHWPDDEGAPVLSWGDARIGNVIFDGFDPAAVLDWEMASIAPREVDVAWCIFLHRFFQDIAEQMELPGMPHFLRRTEVEAAYVAHSGHRPRHMDWHTVYAALRHAVVMSRVQLRTIHFGQAEMPSDPDDLIMHRATLEQMLEGTYWTRIGEA